MKNTKTLLLITFLISTLSIGLLHSCKKDSSNSNNNTTTPVKYCDTAHCGNGHCDSATKSCICDQGYEGTNCMTESRSKFYGTYSGILSINSIPVADTITISSANTNVQSFLLSNMQQHGTSVSAALNTGSTTDFNISTQPFFGLTQITGYGSLGADGRSLNIFYNGNNGTSSPTSCTFTGTKQ
jgi:hypothetical protein